MSVGAYAKDGPIKMAKSAPQTIGELGIILEGVAENIGQLRKEVETIGTRVSKVDEDVRTRNSAAMESIGSLKIEIALLKAELTRTSKLVWGAASIFALQVLGFITWAVQHYLIK